MLIYVHDLTFTFCTRAEFSKLILDTKTVKSVQTAKSFKFPAAKSI